MKKAIVEIKDKQYLVAKGDYLLVDLLKEDKQTFSLQPLLVIDEDKTLVGKPLVKDVVVKAKIVDPDKKQAKVTAIRFKAKKRVHKIRGHRQRKAIIEITNITSAVAKKS